MWTCETYPILLVSRVYPILDSVVGYTFRYYLVYLNFFFNFRFGKLYGLS